MGGLLSAASTPGPQAGLPWRSGGCRLNSGAAGRAGVCPRSSGLPRADLSVTLSSAAGNASPHPTGGPLASHTPLLLSSRHLLG